jgi:hypothetical protein
MSSQRIPIASRGVASSPTPKQPPPAHRKDWYPYYAGFRSDFVGWALSAHFANATHVLDPWNGSGTTTTVAALRGLRATGTDINPAVTIIARGRLTPTVCRDSLEPLAAEIILAATREEPPRRECEPLAAWLRQPAIDALRRLQHGIHVVLADDQDLELSLAHSSAEASSAIPLLARPSSTLRFSRPCATFCDDFVRRIRRGCDIRPIIDTGSVPACEVSRLTIWTV